MAAAHFPAQRATVRTVVLVLVLSVLYAVLPLRGEYWWVGALIGGAILATIAPLAVYRMRRVLVSDRPVSEAFEALVLLLTMLITGFAAGFYAMNRDGTQLSGLDTRLDAVYFTVTTLSTVGFGDVTALSQVARAVVSLQILFNLIFVGLVVRVFSTTALHRAQSTPGRFQGVIAAGSPARDDASEWQPHDDS